MTKLTPKYLPLRLGVLFWLVDLFAYMLILTIVKLAAIAHDQELFIYDVNGNYAPIFMDFASWLHRLWAVPHMPTIRFIERVQLAISHNHALLMDERTIATQYLISTIQSLMLGFLVGVVIHVITRPGQKDAL